MDENSNPNAAGPPPRPERPWQEEQQAISDIDQKIARLEGLPQAPAPVPPPSSGGGGSKRWAGVPVVLAVVFGMRLLFGFSRTHDSPRYEPPPQYPSPVIRVDPDQNQRMDDILRDLREREQNNVQMDVHPQPAERQKPVGPPEP